MGLDIRLPIGGLFSILGVLLVGYGLLSDPGIYVRSLGINVNLWWGVALLVFMLVHIAPGDPISAILPPEAPQELWSSSKPITALTNRCRSSFCGGCW